MSEDLGAPISYLVLAPGTPVLSSDGASLGAVKRVLAAEEQDIFDGLILDTPDGDRFVDADHVAELHERGAILDVRAEDARHLPEPTAGPAAMSVSPDDAAGGHELGDALRRAWDRISGNY